MKFPFRKQKCLNSRTLIASHMTRKQKLILLAAFVMGAIFSKILEMLL